MAEIIDIFDGNHRLIGSLERAAVHQQGLWHQTFHCWIVGEQDGVGFVVLQLRSPQKKSYPNMLDITAAGHLGAGESPEEGVREIQEELGVNALSTSLVRLGIKHDIADEPSGVRNREFAHVFLLRDDRPMTAYTLQESEVSGLVCMPIAEGLRLFSGETPSTTCSAVRLSGGKQEIFDQEIKAADFIPRVDSYYLKIFYLASRLLIGDRYLTI